MNALKMPAATDPGALLLAGALPNGFDIDAAMGIRVAARDIGEADDSSVRRGFRLVCSEDLPGAARIGNAELLAMDVDVLVPAALEAQITRDNASEVRAPIVPDILANAGGVVVSYFEWVQRRAQFYWELDEIERRLEIYMRRAMESVLAKAAAYDCSRREAAFIVAVERVAKAIQQQGIFL